MDHSKETQQPGGQERKEGELVVTANPEELVHEFSRKLAPSREAIIAESPEEISSQLAPTETVRGTFEGENGSFSIEVNPQEELPSSLREIELEEGIGLLARAASNSKAAEELVQDREMKEDLEGFSQNFAGALGWLVNKTGIDKKRAITTLGAGFLAVTLASCGGGEGVGAQEVEITDTGPRETQVASTPTPTETPTQTSTPTPEPTVTPEPSPTPEPISALDTEVQQEVIQEFMARPENQQYSSFEEYLKALENNPYYIERNPDWIGGWGGDNHTLFDLRVVGSIVGFRDIPTDAIEGAPGEVYKTAFLATPELSDRLIPITFAVKTENDGWQLLVRISAYTGRSNGEYIGVTNNPSQYADYYYPPEQIIDVGEEGAFEEWLPTTIGSVANARLKLAWKEPGAWESENIPYYNPISRKLLAVPDSYLARYAGEHEEVFGISDRSVQKVDIERFLEALDPKHDIGGVIGTIGPDLYSLD